MFTIFVIACIIANIVLSVSGSRIISSTQQRYAVISLLDAVLLVCHAVDGLMIGVMFWLVMLCIDIPHSEKAQ